MTSYNINVRLPLPLLEVLEDEVKHSGPEVNRSMIVRDALRARYGLTEKQIEEVSDDERQPPTPIF